MAKNWRECYNNERDYKKSEFFGKWLETFAPNMTESFYQRRIHNQFVWHVFSYELIPAESFLQGDAARQAYNKVNKNGAICFQLFCDDEPKPLPKEFDSAEKLEIADGEYSEFYAVGKDYSWTYILTHETCAGLGPYFMFADKSKR
jgi:hypothetical protein